MPSKITFASMFSGVLGACQGFDEKTYHHLWYCEWDARCQQVIRYHKPGAAIYGDVAALPVDELESPDVLWISPPCQNLSGAGKREGLDGEKSRYFYDAIAAISSLRQRTGKPGIVLMEQVPGLLSSNKRRDFPLVLRAFHEIGARDIAWRELDSRFFGIPQRRRRLFFAVDFDGYGAGEILGLGKGMPEPDRSGREAGSGTSFASGERLARPGESPVVYSVREDATAKNGGNFSCGIADYANALQALEPSENSHHAQNLVVQLFKGEWIVRRLAPVERERLQGWADDWTRLGRTETGEIVEMPDSVRFRMIGNGVSTPVAAEIASRVEALYEEELEKAA